MTIKTAQNDEELKGILDLQALNLKQNMTPEQRDREGFLTVQHNLPLLQTMNGVLGQVVAVEDGAIVGYALTLARSLEAEVPILQPLIHTVNGLEYNGRSLHEASYYILGQLCVAEAFRGKGVVKALYEMHRSQFSKDFDYCITSISRSNQRSLRAHLKVGFQVIHSFSDKTDDWDIVLWDWNS